MFSVPSHNTCKHECVSQCVRLWVWKKPGSLKTTENMGSFTLIFDVLQNTLLRYHVVLSDCFLKIYLVYSYSGTPCILSPLLTPDFCTFWPVYDWPGGSVPLLAAWPAGKPGLCLVHRPLTEGGGVRLDIKSQPTNNGNPRHNSLPRNPPTKFFVKNSSTCYVTVILRQNQNITLFKQATFGNYFEIYQHVCIESVSKNTSYR